jgi:hypothetical protein
MTLLDAPKYDAASARRRQQILWVAVGAVVVLVVGFWLVSGRPVDWPWNWMAHLRGRSAINRFLTDVEKNDLSAAYGVWLHDPDWQKNPGEGGAYDFNRFQQDWSPNSNENEYGAIHSHEILAARISGNVLLAGIRINDLKSKNLFLNYDPRTKKLGFSPVELYLGP